MNPEVCPQGSGFCPISASTPQGQRFVMIKPAAPFIDPSYPNSFLEDKGSKVNGKDQNCISD
jgi:hypothetical protein